MADATAPDASSSSSRGRGRGKSRGGLGKYLRARGRGRGGGRPAVFRERLLLEGEGPDEEEDEEEAAARAAKYARRALGSNADRYAESEPELDSDGEEILEPEVDLSAFLERQRLEDLPEPVLSPKAEDEDDVDHSLAHIGSGARAADTRDRKGKVQTIEWDASLEAMRREKAEAEAHRDLKSRFRTTVAAQKGRASPRGTASARGGRAKQESYTEAPPLPGDAPAPPKGEKAQMEDFLDDLLA